jgi:hypothetical protein
VAQHAKLVCPAGGDEAELAGHQQAAPIVAGDDAAALVQIAVLGLGVAVQGGEVPQRVGVVKKTHKGRQCEEPTPTLRQPAAPCK